MIVKTKQDREGFLNLLENFQNLFNKETELFNIKTVPNLPITIRNKKVSDMQNEIDILNKKISELEAQFKLDYDNPLIVELKQSSESLYEQARLIDEFNRKSFLQKKYQEILNTAGTNYNFRNPTKPKFEVKTIATTNKEIIKKTEAVSLRQEANNLQSVVENINPININPENTFGFSNINERIDNLNSKADSIENTLVLDPEITSNFFKDSKEYDLKDLNQKNLQQSDLIVSPIKSLNIEALSPFKLDLKGSEFLDVKLNIPSIQQATNQTSTSKPVQKNYIKQRLVDTQLLEGDKLDVRKFQYIVPRFYEDPAPGYMTLHSVTGQEILSENRTTSSDEFVVSINNALSRPTLENPFMKNAIYNQFAITGFNETHNEKFQLEDTLSDGAVLFLFGSRPEIWTVSGLLINDKVNNWLGKFRNLWEHHIRASVLESRGQYLKISIPASVISISIYPVGLNIFQSVETEVLVPFSMSFFVRSYKNLPIIVESSFSKSVSDTLLKLAS